MLRAKVILSAVVRAGSALIDAFAVKTVVLELTLIPGIIGKSLLPLPVCHAILELACDVRTLALLCGSCTFILGAIGLKKHAFAVFFVLQVLAVVLIT